MDTDYIVSAEQLTLRASTVLPSPGGPGSLGANRKMKIDTVLPTVTKIYSTTWDGVYTTGDEIVIVVQFSLPVVVDDDDDDSRVIDTGKLLPYVLLNAMDGGAAARYVSGSGTKELRFVFTVAEGDSASRLDCIPGAALARGNAPGFDVDIFRLSTNPTIRANLSLPAPGTANSLGYHSNITIDTTMSSVEMVSVRSPGVSRPQFPAQYIDVDFNCNVSGRAPIWRS